MEPKRPRLPATPPPAFWPCPAEGVAVIPVSEGAWRAAWPAPARPRRGEAPFPPRPGERA